MKRRDFLAASVSAAAFAGGVTRTAASLNGPTNQSCSTSPFPEISGLTKYVANFVVSTTFSDIPGDVVELGKKSILDGLGLALSGSRAETANLILTYAKSFGFTNHGATVIGSSARLPPRFAALANGVAIHVDDFDDTQLAAAKDRVYGLLVHPTVCVLPAVLGTAETAEGVTSGRDLMLAYHVGVEVECKIAEAITPRHYEDGFHSTGTCGVFGGTAACAKLRHFDSEHIVRAFAIAASHSAGLRENFGTMTKPLQAGHAAESGIVATDFAALGWSAADQILEAPRGFFHAYGGSYDPTFILDKLGKPWTFFSPGVSIKPFPSGSLTHPGMTELLRLIRTQHISAVDVVQVEVGTNHNMLNTLIHHRPRTGLQAKFSMEFCMAILLLEGKAGLAEFTDAVVNRPDVQEMIGRIKFYTDLEAEKAGYDKMTTIIKLHLKDGRTVSGRADFGKGSPANPMSYDEVADKFQQCAAFASWPQTRVSKTIETVRELEHLADTRALTSLCSA